MVAAQRIAAVGRMVVVRRMVEAQKMVVARTMVAVQMIVAAGRMVVVRRMVEAQKMVGARMMVAVQRIAERVQEKMVELLVHLSVSKAECIGWNTRLVELWIEDDIAEHRNRMEPEGLVLALLDIVHNLVVLVEGRQHCLIDSNYHQCYSLVLFVHSRLRRLQCQQLERWLHLNFRIDEECPVVDVDNLVLAVEPESLCASLAVVRMVQ